LVLLERQTDLFQIVRTHASAGRFAGGLNGRQEKRYQDADDGDDHQQLHQRKGASVPKHRATTAFLKGMSVAANHRPIGLGHTKQYGKFSVQAGLCQRFSGENSLGATIPPL
jgi:hypothetical protein